MNKEYLIKKINGVIEGLEKGIPIGESINLLNETTKQLGESDFIEQSLQLKLRFKSLEKDNLMFGSQNYEEMNKVFAAVIKTATNIKQFLANPENESNELAKSEKSLVVVISNYFVSLITLSTIFLIVGWGMITFQKEPSMTGFVFQMIGAVIAVLTVVLTKE